MRARPAHVMTRAKRSLARRPWIYWTGACAAALACGATVAQHVQRLDDQRDGWGRERHVLVAAETIQPGDALAAKTVRRPVPAALVPVASLEGLEPGAVARQALDVGSFVTAADVAGGTGDLATVPTGWRVAAIVEAPRSGAALGDRVDVVSDGVVIAEAALVVGEVDGATLVAAEADVAPLVAFAAAEHRVQLLRAP